MGAGTIDDPIKIVIDDPHDFVVRDPSVLVIGRAARHYRVLGPLLRDLSLHLPRLTLDDMEREYARAKQRLDEPRIRVSKSKQRMKGLRP